MKPVLKISRLTNLHDARYCSAVGISLMSFRLDPGHEDSVEPKSAAEIISWLSGPQYIGEFGYQTPDEIQNLLEVVPLSFVEVPLDYHPDLAEEIDCRLIFCPEDPRHTVDTILAQTEVLSSRFPDALFELNFDSLESLDAFLSEAPDLLPRLLIDYPEPDPIYAGLRRQGGKPFGFSLGVFVEEADGVLDYEKCDDFLEQYQELVSSY